MVLLELKKIFDNTKVWFVMATIFIVSIFLLQLELNFSLDPRISHPNLFQEITREVYNPDEELNLYSQYASIQQMEFEGIAWKTMIQD